MSLLKTALATLILGTSLAMSAPASAAQIGGPIGTRPVDPTGTWTASVRWYQPHYVNGVYYQYQYATITASSYTDCNTQLSSYTASPNVQVVQWCILS